MPLRGIKQRKNGNAPPTRNTRDNTLKLAMTDVAVQCVVEIGYDSGFTEQAATNAASARATATGVLQAWLGCPMGSVQIGS